MADGLNISSGMGTGLAQVFNNTGLVGAYVRQQQAEQKRQLQEQKDLEDSIAKINPTGIKDSDIDYINNGYKSVIDSYGAIKNAGSNAERLKAKADFERKKMQLLLDIGRSKGSKEQYLQTKKFGATNFEDELVPDFKNRTEQINSLSTFSPEYSSLDTSDLMTKNKVVDISKGMNDILKMSSTLYQDPNLKSAKFGKASYNISKTLDYDKINTNLLNKANNDPRFNRAINETYLDDFANTNPQDIINEAKSLGIKNFPKEPELEDYVSLQFYKSGKGSDLFEKKETKYLGVPQPRTSGGGGFGFGNYDTTLPDNEGNENITVAFKGGTTNVPILKSTPYTKSINVDLGGTDFIDLSAGRTGQTIKSGSYDMDVSKIADIPMMVLSNGKRQFITKSNYKNTIQLSKSGQPLKDRESGEPIESIVKVPMVIGEVKIPSKYGNRTEKKQVAVPLDQFPVNKNSKSDMTAIEGHLRGGANVVGAKKEVKKLPATPKKATKIKLSKGSLDNI